MLRFGKKVPPAERIKAATRERATRTVEKPPYSHRAERVPTYADCQVTFPLNGNERGIVINVSNTGARIRFRHRVSLPDRVIIHIPRFSVKVEAIVVRSDDFDVGLKFVNSQNLSQPR